MIFGTTWDSRASSTSTFPLGFQPRIEHGNSGVNHHDLDKPFYRVKRRLTLNLKCNLFGGDLEVIVQLIERGGRSECAHAYKFSVEPKVFIPALLNTCFASHSQRSVVR